ncbi:MerR family DNA-binding protein [Myxosarcina sp. GI1]|uniref:MerR family DNA-binding protein n=1 Tax=Myxosarcina sp. GI1 TaxID=1541065 RepID=UPI0006919A9D|nr:MerR family DNA-binding protein [Myxosarcina sp. GI1]
MLTKNNNLLFIGQVAAQSGIPIQTIRYYDELGLLKLSGRSRGGFRQFSEEVFSRLAFIKQAQRLGLSLEEVGELLRICEQRKPLSCGVKQKLKDKICEIDCQIEQLKRLQGELKSFLSE